jgi:hypothetical protein
LKRFRAEHPLEVELLSMFAYLIDYRFAGRLFPSALKVLRRLKGLGPTVTRPMETSSFSRAKSNGRGFPMRSMDVYSSISTKEEALDDVERRFSAERYVLVDDKPRILASVKRFWGTASRPFSRGRVAMLAMREQSVPCRQLMS